jgi:uncharacterized damage-inducible protein DinB
MHMSQIQAEIERINASWSALEQVIHSFRDEQLTRLKRDRWTIKDHLAHIALAEQYWVALVNGQPPHDLFGTTRETLLSASEDELNELGARHMQARSLAQVMELHHDAHQQLLATLASLDDGDLLKPSVLYGREIVGMTMLDTLRGNTYEHYDTHRAWLEAFAAVVS